MTDITVYKGIVDDEIVIETTDYWAIVEFMEKNAVHVYKICSDGHCIASTDEEPRI